MRLNPAAFDVHLSNMGQAMEWRRSYSCPCINPASGLADPKHQLCMGKGRIWDPQVPTVAGVASQKVQAEWMQGGTYETGDTVLSIPQNSAMYEAGQYDRVSMRNSADAFSTSLTRGASNERLLFAVKSIDRVFWLHPQTREIVEGPLPVVSENGVLSWPDGNGPPDDFVYSMTGQRFTEYFIYQNYLSNRGIHQGARLPKRVVLRKWDLFGR